MNAKTTLIIFSFLLGSCPPIGDESALRVTKTNVNVTSSPIATSEVDEQEALTLAFDESINASEIPPLTPSPQIIFTATSIPMPEEGFIWISPPQDARENESYLFRIDVASGDARAIRIPEGCYSLIGGSRKVICRSDKDEIFFVDIYTMEEETSPIRKPLWLSRSPTEQHILYEGYDAELGGNAVFSYDHITGERNEILRTPNEDIDRNLAGFPDASPDGQRMLISIQDPDSDEGRVLVVENNATSQVIGFDGYLTRGVAWSPTENKFIVAVTDKREVVEIFFERDLILYDLNTDTFHLFEIGAIRGVDGSAWSRDGRRIAVTNEPQLCIIEVESLEINCIDYKERLGNSVITSYDWSPSGEELGLVIYFKETGKNSVFIYDPTTDEFKMLVDDVDGEFINWTR